MTLAFRTGETVLFIVDSITDCGRFNALHSPLGDGYVRRISELVAATQPELGLTILNLGISGDTIRDLARRWERDVMRERPDWLCIKIGVNDMWRSVTGPPAEAVPVDEYEQTYRRLLEEVRGRLEAKLVLIEPFLAEPDRADPFRTGLDRYRSVVAELAWQTGARYVGLQAAFDRVMVARTPGYWAPDRVHPTPAGHMLIALEVLRSLGVQFEA